MVSWLLFIHSLSITVYPFEGWGELELPALEARFTPNKLPVITCRHTETINVYIHIHT